MDFKIEMFKYFVCIGMLFHGTYRYAYKISLLK